MSRPPRQPRGPVPKGDWADFALAVGIVALTCMSLTLLGFGWWMILYAEFH